MYSPMQRDSDFFLCLKYVDSNFECHNHHILSWQTRHCCAFCKHCRRRDWPESSGLLVGNIAMALPLKNFLHFLLNNAISNQNFFGVMPLAYCQDQMIRAIILLLEKTDFSCQIGSKAQNILAAIIREEMLKISLPFIV